MIEKLSYNIRGDNIHRSYPWDIYYMIDGVVYAAGLEL